jgi:hypothetical protein
MDEERRRELERERIERMYRRIEKRDPPADERPRLDTVAPTPLSMDQIDERIAEMIRENYEEFLSPLLSRVIAHGQDVEASKLEAAFQKLHTELSKLESEIAQLRAMFYNDKTDRAEKGDKSAPVDLPKLPLRDRRAIN